MFWWQDDAIREADAAARRDGIRRQVRPYAGLWRVSVAAGCELVCTAAVAATGLGLFVGWFA